MKTKVNFRIAAMTTAMFAGTASAQTNGTFLLTSSNVVSPSSPTTTIEIWASWDDPRRIFAFGAADYDLTAGEGEFSNPVNVLWPSNVLGSTGTIAGNAITGAFNGQIFLFPPGFLQLHSDDNPILLATYDWTTADFTARGVGLFTSNTSLFIVVNPIRSTPNSVALYPGEFTPGSGVINVVPGPAAWFVVGVPLAAGIRRRRT